jgi:TetR/AcrR family transcriptional regulator, regulator of cefoperazone and chloramphenicol sensitivity
MCKILNVRSASDLTAAARIRAAAMHLFAARGAAAVSIRDVAARADVSPSLVVHHFGSKSGLREAVDSYTAEVLGALLAELAGAPDDTGQSTAALWTALDGEPDLTAYLRRSMVEAGPTGQRLFGWLVEATERELAALQDAGVIRPSEDPRARAVFLLANDLAPIVLRDLVTGALGVDPLSREGLDRWGRTVMDTYSRGLYTQPPTDEE